MTDQNTPDDATTANAVPVTPRPKRAYAKSGTFTLKAAVSRLGARAIDRRTTLGRELDTWRADLVADLGGSAAISTQVRALVDLAVRTKLLLDSVDAWLLTQKTLVIKRRQVDGKGWDKGLLSVVRERMTLATHLQSVLKDLGLERRTAKAPSLDDYLRRAKDRVEATAAVGDPS